MKAAVSCCSFLLITLLFNALDSGHGIEYMESPARNPEALILEARDEEPQYPDANYDSGEQDRWPTLEELARYSSKRMHYGKRGSYRTPGLDTSEAEQLIGGGKVMSGKSQLPIRKMSQPLKEEDKEHNMRRQNLENSLYDFLSTKSQLPPERQNMESLRDLYLAADLLKRHRLPRNIVDPPSVNNQVTGEQEKTGQS